MLRLLMTILWPAFLAAIVAEGCFFSLFDPSELVLLNGRDIEPLAAYTLGFFFFWVFCSLASGLTYYLSQASAASSAQVAPARRPAA